jgi:hypothetical protein
LFRRDSRLQPSTSQILECSDNEETNEPIEQVDPLTLSNYEKSSFSDDLEYIDHIQSKTLIRLKYKYNINID